MDECTCGAPEQWVPIPEQPRYEVSDHGRVRSLVTGSPRLLKLQPNRQRGGYPHFRCTPPSKTYKIHVQVMRLFAGPRPKGLDIRHLDGDVMNAHVWNMAYGTPTENAQDTLKHGRHNNASKTHCKRDHPFTEANTYVDRKGRRFCRECARTLGRESYARVGKPGRRPSGWANEA